MKALCALLAMAALPASAIYPESGWYLYETSNGQCLGCAYRPATTNRILSTEAPGVGAAAALNS